MKTLRSKETDYILDVTNRLGECEKRLEAFAGLVIELQETVGILLDANKALKSGEPGGNISLDKVNGHWVAVNNE